MSEWRSLTLGDICKEAGGGIQTGPFGSQLHASDYVIDGTPSVMPQNIGDNRIVPDGIARVCSTDMERLRRHWLTPGDIVYSRRGDVERRALVRGENAGWLCGTGCLRIRIEDPSVHDSRFVSYALGLEESRAWIVRHAVGATMLNLNTSILSAVPLQVPDVVDQQAIAEVLGALDDKIAANDRIFRTSLELARAGFQRELQARSREHATLADLCARGWLHVSDGYRTKRSEHGHPGLRILRAGDVRTDSIIPTGPDFVSDEFREAIGMKASQPGDVIMTTKGTVGRVGVIPSGVGQVVFSPQLCYFRVLDPTRLAPGFLSGWFRSDDVQRQAEARMYKSDMAPYINLKDIQTMTMPVMPPADQHRIGEAQSALERMAHAVLHDNGILAKTRDQLLPLLMSGKLRVRDAELRIEDSL